MLLLVPIFNLFLYIINQNRTWKQNIFPTSFSCCLLKTLFRGKNVIVFQQFFYVIFLPKKNVKLQMQQWSINFDHHKMQHSLNAASQSESK